MVWIAADSGPRPKISSMLPSGVSMLWESVDATDALRTRFGFDGFGAADAWVSGILNERWDVLAQCCRRMVISGPNLLAWVDSSGGPLVVKWSNAPARFEKLAASTRLLHWLGVQDLPVAAPLVSLDAQTRVVLPGPLGPLSVAVLPELSGDWLDVRDAEAVRAAGAALAQLHEALGRYPDAHTFATREVEPIGGRLQRWLLDGDRGLAPRASARLAELVTDRAAPELSPWEDEPQLVHHDFRAANILTRGSAVTAVLDFDETGFDYRVCDLARASVMLTTRFTDWRPTPDAVRRQFLGGYESVRTLEAGEAAWLDPLVLWIAVESIPWMPDPQGWAQAVEQMII